MFERLTDLARELDKLEAQLPEMYAAGDQRAAADAGRRIAELRPVVEVHAKYQATEADLRDALAPIGGARLVTEHAAALKKKHPKRIHLLGALKRAKLLAK